MKNPILLDGRYLAATIKGEIAAEVTAMKKQGKRAPHLAAILVGDDSPSHTYVKHKIAACKEVGFQSTLLKYGTIQEKKLLQVIDTINQDEFIDGLLVQLPLPPSISSAQVVQQISPSKDVDGFHPLNYGKMATSLPAYIPATPHGILEILRRYEVLTQGKHCVVVGSSFIVGAPISILMSREDYPGKATVTLCHKHTQNLGEHARRADILIVAVGKPGLITGDMVKEGAIVIDVGTTYVPDATKKSGHTIKGDVVFEEVAPKCSHITPVPGGVGPMTIASLLLNTLKAARTAPLIW